MAVLPSTEASVCATQQKTWLMPSLQVYTLSALTNASFVFARCLSLSAIALAIATARTSIHRYRNRHRLNATNAMAHVGFNSTPQHEYCPQLCPSNGAYNRSDGSILIGTYIAPGCLKHPKDAFANVYDRIRKSVECGHELLLEIVEAYPPEKKVPRTIYEKCEDWLLRISTPTQKLLPAPTV